MNSDHLPKIVNNLQFLKYDYSIEDVKLSQLDFPDHAKDNVPVELSNFGVEVVKNFLHVGLVTTNKVNDKLTSNRALLTIWPSFMSPTCYRKKKKKSIQDLKTIKVMIFRVPESVFEEHSTGNATHQDILASVSILRPHKEWILLEKLVISSFFHLVFDETNEEPFGNKNVRENYQIDKLDTIWKQLLFICCGPRDLAYEIKKLLKRNWHKIARNAVSIELNIEKEYLSITQGDVLHLLILWSRFSVHNNSILDFLRDVNSVKPAHNPTTLLEQTKFKFASHIAHSKKHRCYQCRYATNRMKRFEEHMKEHEEAEEPNNTDLFKEQLEKHEDLENVVDMASLHFERNEDEPPEEYDLDTDDELENDYLSTQESTKSIPKIRRSRRVTGSSLKELMDEALHYQILTGSNELLIDVYLDPVKGRGCRAAKEFQRNEFVLEYKGTLVERKKAMELEEMYSEDYNIGSFMYFFTHKSKQFCLDATEETPYKGRLINHSVIKPNLNVKLVELHGRPYLVFRAARNIDEGEELLFDYGETRAEIVQANPWLVNS